jgi:hypothetical protein
MRESLFFEVRVRRFEVWQMASGTVAFAAIAAVTAWAVAMWDTQSQTGAAIVVGSAALLAMMTIAAGLSLARVEGGILACRDGLWTYVPDVGVARSGALEVAIDLGAFLLLRLVDRGRVTTWLPVQRRGLEREWHALRCAVYSPPPVAGASPTAPPLTTE